MYSSSDCSAIYISLFKTHVLLDPPDTGLLFFHPHPPSLKYGYLEIMVSSPFWWLKYTGWYWYQYNIPIFTLSLIAKRKTVSIKLFGTFYPGCFDFITVQLCPTVSPFRQKKKKKLKYGFRAILPSPSRYFIDLGGNSAVPSLLHHVLYLPLPQQNKSWKKIFILESSFGWFFFFNQSKSSMPQIS